MQTAAQGSGMGFFWMLFLLIAIFWVWLPMRNDKKRKEAHQAKADALQKGDQIIIQGGIIGTVVGFKDEAVEVKVADNVKLTVLKSGIVGFISNAAPATKKGGAK